MPSGLVVTQVNDVLIASNKKCEEEFKLNLGDEFKFGSKEKSNFRYMGMKFH